MNKRERQFQQTVLEYYRVHGRRDLPWRKTTKPYHILVSEVMLQQTQVERVVLKYQAFIHQFPNVRALARAPLQDVLTVWQGLGYNRRAQALQRAARRVVEVNRGQFPQTYEELLNLPGVGPYTAAAIMAFAYNKALPLIETNVRTVFIHHFFKHQTNVSDAALLKLVTRTLPSDNARVWYAALMDYGAYLKRTIGNLNTQSKHYSKQSAFKGSDRQVRGAIVRHLTRGSATRVRLKQHLSNYRGSQVDTQLDVLVREGMVEQCGRQYMLPG